MMTGPLMYAAWVLLCRWGIELSWLLYCDQMREPEQYWPEDD